MRLEKPHSLSYQLHTFTRLPLTRVIVASKLEVVEVWLKSMDTNGPSLYAKIVPSAASFMTAFTSSTLVSRDASNRLVRQARAVFPKMILAVVVFFLIGEAIVRVMFSSGASFGNHSGPIVRRFERGFRYNGYGRSRGPGGGFRGVAL